MAFPVGGKQLVLDQRQALLPVVGKGFQDRVQVPFRHCRHHCRGLGNLGGQCLRFLAAQQRKDGVPEFQKTAGEHAAQLSNTDDDHRFFHEAPGDCQLFLGMAFTE